MAKGPQDVFLNDEQLASIWEKKVDNLLESVVRRWQKGPVVEINLGLTPTVVELPPLSDSVLAILKKKYTAAGWKDLSVTVTEYLLSMTFTR